MGTIGLKLPVPVEESWRDKLHHLVSISFSQATGQAGIESMNDQATFSPSGGSNNTSPDDTDAPVFVSRESVITFPVASLVVTMIWKVIKAAFPFWGASTYTPLIIAFAVGLFIYYISIKDNMSKRNKRIALGIAIINSFFLAAGALGIDAST